jgi:transcriptional regulator with XRE-family HTH domain
MRTTYATLPSTHWRRRVGEVVGGRMRMAREQLGWSERAIAEAIGVQVITYRAYEQGEKAIPVDVIVGLSRITKVCPGLFLPTPEELTL